MVVAVYLRQFFYNHMFGVPMVVSVPTTDTNYEQFYDIVLKRLSRYVTVPDPSEEWWKNTSAEDEDDDDGDGDDEDEDVDEDEDEDEVEDDQRGPPKLFTIDLVDYRGTAFQKKLPNDGSALKFPEQSYARLDWHCRAKELFFNNDLANWDFEVQFDEHRMFAMKSWLYGGIRFFATLFTGTEAVWHLWVTAACGRNDAKKLRAEIRLSSNLVPDCSDVFFRPGKEFVS